MMRTLLCYLLLVCSLFAEDLPLPHDSESASLKGLVWNKWETDNFIILSIDFGFGDRLKSDIESTKSNFCRSWGIEDLKLPRKCKLVCVPDPTMLKNFFGLDGPRIEDESQTSVWIDEQRISQLDEFVARLCLKENKSEFLRRGIPLIVSSEASEISSIILSSSNIKDDFFSGKNVTDHQSVVACLFFRKEFGVRTFSVLASSNPPSPEEACGFPDRSSLQSSLSRYLNNLQADLRSGRTPEAYLKP